MPECDFCDIHMVLVDTNYFVHIEYFFILTDS